MFYPSTFFGWDRFATFFILSICHSPEIISSPCWPLSPPRSPIIMRGLLFLTAFAAAVLGIKVQPHVTLASQLQTLSRKAVEKKQDPAGQAPGEVDAAGYEEDWGDEFHNGVYPESSRGKAHHPDNSEKKPVAQDNYWWW